MRDQLISGNWDIVMNTSFDFSNPAGFITVMVILATFGCLACIAVRKDRADAAALRDVNESADSMHEALRFLYDYHYSHRYTGRLSESTGVHPAVLLVLKEKLSVCQTFAQKHKFLAPFFGSSTNTTSHFNRLVVLLCTLLMQLFVTALWYNQAPVALSFEEQMARGLVSVMVSVPLGVIIAVLFNKSSKTRRDMLLFAHFLQQNLGALVIQRSYWRWREKRGLPIRPYRSQSGASTVGSALKAARTLKIQTDLVHSTLSRHADAVPSPRSPLSGNVTLPKLKVPRNLESMLQERNDAYAHQDQTLQHHQTKLRTHRRAASQEAGQLAGIVVHINSVARGAGGQASALQRPDAITLPVESASHRRSQSRSPQPRSRRDSAAASKTKAKGHTKGSFLTQKFVDPDERENMWPVWLEKVAWGVAAGLIAFCSYFVVQFGFSMGNSITLKWLTSVSTSFATDTFLISPLKVLILSVVVPRLLARMKLSKARMRMVALMQGDWGGQDDSKGKSASPERPRKKPLFAAKPEHAAKAFASSKSPAGTLAAKDAVELRQLAMPSTSKASPDDKIRAEHQIYQGLTISIDDADDDQLEITKAATPQSEVVMNQSIHSAMRVDERVDEALPSGRRQFVSAMVGNVRRKWQDSRSSPRTLSAAPEILTPSALVASPLSSSLKPDAASSSVQQHSPNRRSATNCATGSAKTVPCQDAINRAVKELYS